MVALGLVAALVGLAPVAPAAASPSADAYHQTNLVADRPGLAQLADPDLVNPWGLAAGATTPAWVADNGTDKATLDPGFVHGSPIGKAPLVVTILGGAPTGQVFNPTPGFEVQWAGQPPGAGRAAVGGLRQAGRRPPRRGRRPGPGGRRRLQHQRPAAGPAGPAGPVERPVGLVRAPAVGFGRFSGALLVGTFGDGHINA